MVQTAVLLAGILILCVSIVFAYVGNIKKTRTSQALDQVGANVGRDYGIEETRIPFAVRDNSKATLNVKVFSGRVEIALKQAPFSASPEDNIGWTFPALYSMTLEGGVDRSEHMLEPGTYIVAIRNDHGGDSQIEVNLTLRYEVEAYPKLYDIGIQMLIVAVPLIVAGILS